MGKLAPHSAAAQLAVAHELGSDRTSPFYLEVHKQIRAATEKLRTVAREEKASVHGQFAVDLAAHARSEEEVLYPAAISSATSSGHGGRRNSATSLQ